MHRFALSACALLLVLSLLTGAARADSYSGTWSIAPSSRPGKVQLELRYHTGDTDWEESRPVNAPHIRNNAFTIVEDAGEFRAQGTFNGAEGAGTWTFVPNPAFDRELQQRGLSAPSELDQFGLAMSGFHIATLDALLAAGFERPSIRDLIRLNNHGIDAAYINEMKTLHFAPKNVDSLVRLRDHGVTPEYIASLQRLGYSPSANDLVRLVDHGVTADFIARMRSHGYTHLSADELIRLRDHGF